VIVRVGVRCVGQVGSPSLDPLGEPVGQRPRLRVPPVVVVGPCRAEIVQYKELTDTVDAGRDEPVVPVGKRRIPAIRREMLDELLDAVLDEEDPGGLEWLYESTR